MNKALQPLLSGIQHNCHISNARHAGNYTLCVYLLKMREYYRWEQGQPYNTSLDKDQLGEWISAREELWESLEKKDFVPLQLNNQKFDPFDSAGINQQLIAHNLVYSAGYGNGCHPHFFLADLESLYQQDGSVIYISGKEYVRDLTAPPAMTQGNTIFIRRESFRRMIWEKYEEWLWNKPDNAMQRALQFYPFGIHNKQALDAMTENELHMALYHEIGEIKATALLGEQWLEILSSLPRSKGEIMFRAVKDHLADSLSTFPQLMNDFKPQSLHFYIANLTSMRKILSPGLISLYEQWVKEERLNEGLKVQSLTALQAYAEMAKKHWLQLARKMIDLKGQFPDKKTYIEQLALLIEKNAL